MLRTRPNHRAARLVLALLAAAWSPIAAHAQFDLQDSHTTASLRGIHSLGGGVAWASGTGGAVLRTEDGGYLWQGCATPPGAEKLDFRGIQAFDANTAIVMSSGKGDLSRLYKTTDGCRTWKLLFTNPDSDGFWDAIKFTNRQSGYLLGDPVPISTSDQKVFAYFHTADGGQTWIADDRTNLNYFIYPDTAIFAASNSSMLIRNATLTFVIGGSHANLIVGTNAGVCDCIPRTLPDGRQYVTIRLPLAEGATAGGFSLASTEGGEAVAVGGDYSKPNETSGTAAYSIGEMRFLQWHAAKTPPHGYRSSVAYDSKSKTWITTGPNGTDISTDDGKNWTALKLRPGQPADTDKNWNALSLPFVVGPHGRIGKLRDDALKTAKP